MAAFPEEVLALALDSADMVHDHTDHTDHESPATVLADAAAGGHACGTRSQARHDTRTVAGVAGVAGEAGDSAKAAAMDVLYSQWFDLLSDNIWSVRAHAAVTLGQVMQVRPIQ